MEEHAANMIAYIQERCLWQFHSRSWDREANITGVMTTAAKLLTGEPVVLDTLADKGFYADAKILVADVQSRFAWLQDLDATQITALVEMVKARLIGLTITHSLNEELRIPNY